MKKKLTELKNKKEKLEERYVYSEIEHEMYIRFLNKIESEITEIESKVSYKGKDISNLKNQLNKSIEFTQNNSKH